jgi:DNA (cytosine-5)-methyltransferase 1
MLTAISLYTGVGGLDFGFEAAGFRTAVAVEIDPIACRTIRLNRKWRVLEGNIHEISSQRILHAAGLRPGEADVLIGGPPCQPFSKSSHWVNGDSGRLDDPRANTLTAYLRVLRDTRPRMFLLENVPGLAYKGKDEGMKHLLQGIEGINRKVGTSYRLSWRVLNSVGYGVPQIRERVFLVGSRDGEKFEFPSYTHGERGELPLEGVEPPRTAWDALGDLPEPNDPSLKMGGYWAELLPTIPEGQNYLGHTNRGGGKPLFGWRTRYWSFLLKLAKKLPSWTIQAQPGSAIGPFHWRNRKLSVHEMCRLQTFPDGLTVDCGRTDVQRMLGNAVPSLMTEVIAWSMRRQFLGDRKRPLMLKLLPPARQPVPAPERVQALPRKYHDQIGTHDDHPGEGKGAGAKRRNGGEAEGGLFAKTRLRKLLETALTELDQDRAGRAASTG